MIIQGSNLPIIITFDEDMSSLVDWSMSLFMENKRTKEQTLLRHWGLHDIAIDGATVSAPLTEEETVEFPVGVATLEMKWLTQDETIFHSDIIRIRIAERNDTNKLIQNN